MGSISIGSLGWEDFDPHDHCDCIWFSLSKTGYSQDIPFKLPFNT